MDFRSDSRFFMGKNKVMMLALGKTVEDEYQDNLRRVSKNLRGQVSERFRYSTCQYFCPAEQFQSQLSDWLCCVYHGTYRSSGTTAQALL